MGTLADFGASLDVRWILCSGLSRYEPIIVPVCSPRPTTCPSHFRGARALDLVMATVFPSTLVLLNSKIFGSLFVKRHQLIKFQSTMD